MAEAAVREFLSGVDSGSTGGAPITRVTGAGTAAGDILVLLHAVDFYDFSTPTPTGGAGTWTRRVYADGGTNGPQLTLWTCPLASGGAKTVTVANQSDAANYLALWVVSGDGLSIEDFDGQAPGGAATTSHVLPSMDLSAAPGIQLGGFMVEPAGAVNYTFTGSGLAKDVELDAATFSTLAAGHALLAAPGATGTRTVTSSAARKYASAGIVIRSITAAAPIEETAGRAAEVDNARPVPVSKSKAGGGAEDTETALAITAAKSRTTGPAAELDTAPAAGRVVLVGRAEETSIAAAVTATKAVVVQHAAEVDTAARGAAARRVTVHRSAETGTAPGAGRAKQLTTAPAVEADSAAVVSGAVTVHSAAEQDTAGTVRAAKRVTVGGVDEEAAAGTVSPARSLTIGVAGSTDLARPVLGTKRRTVVSAEEADSSGSMPQDDGSTVPWPPTAGSVAVLPVATGTVTVRPAATAVVAVLPAVTGSVSLR